MKKLVIMLIAAVVGVCANAAAVSWQVKSATDWKSGTVYGITGYSSTEVIALFQSGTASDWSKAVADAGSSTINPRGVGNSMSENAGSTMVFAFVSSDGIAEGKTWAVSSDISTSGYTYTPPSNAPGTLAFTYAASSTGTFTSVPEPTSGILMLLGMAGLALRRRRA